MKGAWKYFASSKLTVKSMDMRLSRHIRVAESPTPIRPVVMSTSVFLGGTESVEKRCCRNELYGTLRYNPYILKVFTFRVTNYF